MISNIPNLQQELDELYIKIGSNECECTDEILERISILKDLIDPSSIHEYQKEFVGCGCSDPNHCWECVAIRGGCPEDV